LNTKRKLEIWNDELDFIISSSRFELVETLLVNSLVKISHVIKRICLQNNIEGLEYICTIKHLLPENNRELSYHVYYDDKNIMFNKDILILLIKLGAPYCASVHDEHPDLFSEH
jgi:hypothetical protein